MTESISIRTPNRLILPNNIPAKIKELYNGLGWIRLFRKGRFKEVFGGVGVRRYGKFKLAADFFSYFNTAIWEYVLTEVIENRSVVFLKDMRFTVKDYKIKPHLNPDLIANNFRLSVPTVKVRTKVYLIWVTKSIIEYLNTRENFVNTIPKVIRQNDIKVHLQKKFPGIKATTINKILSFCISFMRNLILLQHNPTLRYKNTDCVVGPFDFRFCRKEGEAYPFVKAELYQERRLEKFIDYVKRNYN